MDSRKIKELREKMLGCKERCNGVLNDIGNGIIPRGMIYEASCSSGDSPLIVVVGPNPGNSSEKEKEKVKEINKINNLLKGLGFDGKPEEFFGSEFSHSGSRYYPGIRLFINILENIVGKNCRIYWTEIIKCESDENKNLVCSTILKCYEEFLKKELELIKDEEYRIFVAVGRVAYDLLDSINFMKGELLLGVPHPSARTSFYKNIKNGESKIMEDIRKVFKEHIHRDLIKDYL